MSFDPTLYYQLTHQSRGPGQALDVNPDGSGRLVMATKKPVSGQHWRVVDLGGGKHALPTQYLGDGLSLNACGSAPTYTPCMAPTGSGPGQTWTLQPQAGGTFRLTNDLAGLDLSPDTAGDPQDLVFAPGEPTGQHWLLTSTVKVESTVAIPDFVIGVQPGEGATDFALYAQPLGVVRAVMIFVDFDDAPAPAPGGTAAAEALALELLGKDEAKKLLHEQSYGNFTLDVTVKSDLGWRRMPGASTHLDTHASRPHRAYIEHTAKLFENSVRFSDYHFVFVVAPEQAALGGASAFTAYPNSGAASSSGEIRLAVTFNGKPSQESFTTLVHEVGHLFGLPDHYPANGDADGSLAGCWSVMSDIFRATGFLGWHRHKNGWLADKRKAYLEPGAGPWWGTLHPLSGSHGLSMVVIPIGDPATPSRFLVIELAQRSRGPNGTYGEGVLLYRVDTTLGSGCSPVAVLPRTRSFSPDFGNLFEAPYQVNDEVEESVGKARMRLKVEQRFGEAYYVSVAFS